MNEVLTSMLPEELEAHCIEMGESKFRAKQLIEWMYRRRATTFEEMSNLSVPFRAKLVERFALRSLTLHHATGSHDTTRKMLFRCADGRYIESVLIPANPDIYGERTDRRTLCVSTQVGCAMDCKFCASGLAGLTRNLEASEIVEQILQAEAVSGERVDNLVFMGMGEPLANLKNVLKAIQVLNAAWGLAIGARKITLSTSGIVPSIIKLADFPLQIRLAISLHGATDEVREKIMPVNKKWPLAELMEALRYFASKKKQMLMLEYILIDGVNDSLEQAVRLSKIAKGLHAKINLIPYNTVEGLPWQRPSEEKCERFRDVLRQANLTATLRREKGHDIDAACGQLRLKEERKEGLVDAPVKLRAS
jgi:23S rRNA (adenine2503-C2)-methyltransferase